jgi:hypothetical protein
MDLTRRRSLGHAVFAASVLLSSLTASAQAPPDFSGRWTIPAPPTGTAPAPGTAAAAPASGDMGSGWGPNITIAQDAARLSVEYSPFSRYDLQPPLVFVYQLDGSESRTTVVMGRGAQMESSRVSWTGQTLTITTTFNVADRPSSPPLTMTVTRKLSLESPTTLVVEATRSGVLGGPSSTTRTIYQKS